MSPGQNILVLLRQNKILYDWNGRTNIDLRGHLWSSLINFLSSFGQSRFLLPPSLPTTQCNGLKGFLREQKDDCPMCKRRKKVDKAQP